MAAFQSRRRLTWLHQLRHRLPSHLAIDDPPAMLDAGHAGLGLTRVGGGTREGTERIAVANEEIEGPAARAPDLVAPAGDGKALVGG